MEQHRGQDPNKEVGRGKEHSLVRMAAALQPGQDFPPEFYRALSQFLQRDAAERFFAPKLALAGNEAVLDLGCGEGKVTHDIITPKVPRGSVLGIDINPAAVEGAKQSFEQEGGNIRFLVGDIETMADVIREQASREKAIPSSFDCICSNFTLHWPKNLERCFQEMRKLLSSGGKMVHLFSSSDPFPELFGAAHAVIQTERWKGYFDNGQFRHPTLRGFPEVVKALQCAGFQLVEGQEQAVWHTFPNESVLAAWVGKMPRPLVSKIPESEHAEFGKDVVAHYRGKVSQIADYPALPELAIAVRHNMILFVAKSITPQS